ncbi:type I-E CRISPR-associated protein Cse1/CasA [Allostella vacuolata]|nr:type I-E CRISPR-associated protein Cse1/CasA [Stella vacuolata]
MHLHIEPWLPAVLSDGTRRWIRPAEVTADIATNPVVDFAWGRADFDAATLEFLIGLLATAGGERLDDGEMWEDWFLHPPTPGALDELFAPLATAFALDGPGPRFAQDLEELPANGVSVGQLLIEAPGANTLKKNLDHFVHRGGVERLSRPAAAMAIFTLQAYAPTGGAGVRTSLRGGGPLTTLVRPAGVPGRAEPLWRTLWLNALRPPPEPGSERTLARIFPWLAPTRVSDKGVRTTPGDVDPLQAYWGMPRRIRLDFEANPDGLPCDLTGLVDPVMVTTYRSRPHGTNYEAFRHPLTPHYLGRPADPTSWLPVHGQPGRIAYRDWLGLAISDDPENPRRQPAQVVVLAGRRLGWIGLTHGARLTATGYDMDNMKARDLIESEMPLHLSLGSNGLDGLARAFVLSAREAAFVLGICLRDAGGHMPAGREAFWEETAYGAGSQPGFHVLVERTGQALAAAGADETALADASMAARRAWRGVLERKAMEIFDRLAPLTDLDALRQQEMQRRIAARRSLLAAMRGSGMGRTLYRNLGLQAPNKSGAGPAGREATP